MPLSQQVLVTEVMLYQHGNLSKIPVMFLSILVWFMKLVQQKVQMAHAKEDQMNFNADLKIFAELAVHSKNSEESVLVCLHSLMSPLLNMEELIIMFITLNLKSITEDLSL